MTGCRYGAKNTLVKNYLGLAESAGAQVHPMTTVTGFKQRPDGLWEVKTARTGRLLRRKRRTFTATHLVLAAGTFGTQKLLFKMRDSGKLPKLSDKLGVLTRTNSESIVGAGRLEVRDDLDLTHGVAITSSIHPTADTHVEPVRYGKGSNAMGLLQTLMTDGAGPGGTDAPRWRQLLDQAREDPKKMLRMLNPRQWSERTMIALVMQHLDNSITTYTKRDQARLPPDGRASRATASRTRPGFRWATRSPAGIAEKIDGVAGGTWGELFNIPLTAHFLGGAAIGDSPEHGVIDPYQRVYSYPTMYGGGRRRDLGEPRRQPVAEHHRAGRAGGVAVAEQGRGGPAAARRARPTGDSRRSRPSIPSCPPMRRRVAAHPARTERTGQLGGLKPRGTGYYSPAKRYGVPRSDLARLLRSPVGRHVRTGRGRDGPRVTRPCCRQIWSLPNRSSPTTGTSRTSRRATEGAALRLLALAGAGGRRSEEDRRRAARRRRHRADGRAGRACRQHRPASTSRARVAGRSPWPTSPRWPMWQSNWRERRRKYCCRPTPTRRRNCARRTTSSTPAPSTVHGADRPQMAATASVLRSMSRCSAGSTSGSPTMPSRSAGGWCSRRPAGCRCTRNWLRSCVSLRRAISASSMLFERALVAAERDGRRRHRRDRDRQQPNLHRIA